MGIGGVELNVTQVIVADDIPSARKIVARILNKLGVGTVIECKNAAEVLSALSSNPQVGLIISDRMMPDTSGIDLLRALRAQPAHQRIPFLLVSSSVTEQDALTVHEFGCADILLKPFSSSALSAKLAVLAENVKE